ncbi:site-specific integrase [Pseudomonas sp. JQ170]|uniref:site-specific integrase n=1 Tax=unclassified Pseudomonas TaxID=196821 RepID=UPI0026515987|nr:MULTISPECIES: site-specific integrase [unclassified Pseudomonas]MDN7144026.1 site-specific integrase [Pseudomonas sp. JQ170]WRO74985.1 site-specific integrase [Pseudomonas sp. 170C]
MSDAADHYLQAARRASTQRRYAQAIEHFEAEWGGMLPASSESVVRYLAAYGATASASTLRTHLAALAQWHQQHGFVDPTKAPRVRDTLRGIQALHPRPVKQAEALQLQALEDCIGGLQVQLGATEPGVGLRAARDQALILLGFWRALRGDELCRLQAEYVQIREGEGIQLFLPSSKTDRANRGRNLTMPALKRLCPVQACAQWLEVSGVDQGPLFRAIDRWGHVSEQALNANSVSRLLRQALLRSGVDAEGYSAHSLRRGFATWASRNQWSSKELMAYVGWRDVQTAARYIDGDAPFGEWVR